MFGVSLGIYVIFMAFIWGFFLVAKIHFYKYREYSKYVVPSTKVIMLMLLVLTVLGGYFVFKYTGNFEETKTAQEEATNEVY